MTVFAGFDPGIGSPAVAVIRRLARGYELLAAKTLRTSPKDTLEERLAAIWAGLSPVLRELHPGELGIERQAGAQVGAWERGEFNGDNSKTLWTCGVAFGCAVAYGVVPVIIDPKRAKIAVLGKGAGSAEKRVVRDRIQAMMGAAKLTLDASDAVALAIAVSQAAEARSFDQATRAALERKRAGARA